MNNPIGRQLVTCLAVFASVAGLSQPSWGESNSSQFVINQWIRQSEDGSVGGRLGLPQSDGATLAISPATVGLVGEYGEMKTSQTGEDGSFRFEGVEPGVYTLISRGADDVCSVIALHVVAAEDERAVELPQDIELAAGQIPFASINSMMIRYLPPSSLLAKRSAPFDVNVNAITPRVAGRGVHRITQTDGGLVGQVYGAGATGNLLNPSSQTNIFLFQNTEEVHRTVSDSSGAFQVDSLSPGVYSALFVGASGMGLVGFELVSEHDRSFASATRGGSLVNVQDAAVSSQLVMQVAPGDDVVNGLQGIGMGSGDVLVEETVIVEEVADTGFTVPMGGGGFAGGGGGAGGAGGDRRNIGGLLAIGGLVAGIVALATDDDSPTPPPATPAEL